MPYLLVEGTELVCDHGGATRIRGAGQALVRIDGKQVLVKGDPGGQTISRCPNVGATIKPCTSTLPETKGDSTLIYIKGTPVCLDTVEGLTDGTPPGVVEYKVRRRGQEFVSEVS